MNWLSFLFYCGLVLAVYSVLAIPILMELSLRTPKRDTAGLLRVNPKSWTLANLYRSNAFFEEKDGKWPKNICQLYCGLWWGTLLTAVVTMIILLICLLGFFCGYLASSRRPGEIFHNFERWGKDGKKAWIAPWKFFPAVAWLSLAIFWPDISVAIVEKFTDFINITAGSAFASTIIKYYLRYFLYAVSAIIIIAALIALKNIIAKSESWAATKDFLISIKYRLCIRTTID
jgi:hypothetical protein